MSAPDRRWVPAFAAFDTLRRQYEAANFYADDEVCWRVASDTLLRRLETGQLPARAASARLTWDDGNSIEEADVFPLSGGKESIPSGFWRYFKASYPVHQESDWLAGDFAFVLQDKSKGDFLIPTCRGHVIGLEVDAIQLPQVSIPEAGRVESAPARSGGRPAANWWPDFAEELAVYIHEKGLPAGQGHEGQSELIDGVFARMAEQGKLEPGRGTVQAVVNAVLRRIRSAGN